MPQNRKRVTQSGAKSIGVRTKHKIGGRKSSRGAGTMSTADLSEALGKVRKRDRNKLRRQLEARGWMVNRDIVSKWDFSQLSQEA